MSPEPAEQAFKDQFDAAVKETKDALDHMVKIRGNMTQDYINFEDESTLFKQRMGRWTRALKEGRIAACGHLSPKAPQPAFGSIPLIDLESLLAHGIELPDWILDFNDTAVIVCGPCSDALIAITTTNNLCDGCGRESEYFHETTVNFGPIMLFGNLCDRCMEENDYKKD